MDITSFALPKNKTLTMPSGEEVELRPITVDDDDVIGEVFPWPVMPQQSDPMKGSNAPMIDNPNDPEYRKKVGKVSRKQGIAKLVIATRYKDDDGVSYTNVGDDDRGKWLRSVVDVVSGAIPNAWYNKAMDVIDPVESMTALVAEAGLGNSTSSSTTTAS